MFLDIYSYGEVVTIIFLKLLLLFPSLIFVQKRINTNDTFNKQRKLVMQGIQKFLCQYPINL